jgi:phage-related protein
MQTDTSDKTTKIKSLADTCASSVHKSFDGNAGNMEVAGKNMMIGVYNGLVGIWNDTVKPFIETIAPWIKDNKGPEEYDRKLLVSNGKAIMEGLYDGLTNGFEGDVKPEVEGMAGVIEEAMSSDPSVEFTHVSDAFKVATTNMMEYWKVGLDQMTREVQRFAAITRETMADVYSPFAQGVMNGLSLTAQSASAYRAPTQVNATLELDRVQFGRMVYQIGDEESQRVGVKLAGGYA